MMIKLNLGEDEMMNKLKNNTDYLTHYTNVESLEKILSTRSFKFNAAKNLNDFWEGKSRDSDIPIQCMMYSSSWCEDISLEGIKYMWNNYAKTENGGIRIFAPKHIFKKHVYNHQINKPIKTYLPYKYHEEFIPFEQYYSHLYKIEYTDDMDKTFPNIKSKDRHWDEYNIFKLGKYKEKRWSIEKEYRYCLFLMHKGLLNVPIELRDLAIKQYYPESIFIEFRWSIYKKMIIQLSKDISKENEIKVYNLAKKYKFKVMRNDGKIILNKI